MEIGKRQRALPRAVARRVSFTVTKRAAILIGFGMFLGTSLGTAAGAAVRDLALRLMGAH